jgi:hypothetical protein
MIRKVVREILFTEYCFLVRKQTKFMGFPLEYIEKLMDCWRQNIMGKPLPRKINIQIKKSREEPE